MSEVLKNLDKEADGMTIYECIVNNAANCGAEMPELIYMLKNADHNGQFLSSLARYLAAVDRERFEPYLSQLLEGAIEKDRERRYIGSLLESLWGSDYRERAEELKEKDDNFRRIYKRIFNDDNPL